MPNPSQHKEALHKPSVTESVQSLIDRKQHEKESRTSSEVSQKMAGTQEGVADVLAGMEKPSEKFSERKGEGGQQGDLKTGKAGVVTGQTAQQIRDELKDYHFPKEEIMVREIRAAIEGQIDMEWKRAQKLQKKLDQGGAEAYNASIARIRKLKDLLSMLFDSTVDYLKSLYTHYFTPNGARKKE